MKDKPSICVFFSFGPNYVEILRHTRAHHPDATICAMVPAGYPMTDEERSFVDEVVETELPSYSPRDPKACWRLVKLIRSRRFDRFVVMYESVQLRILAGLSGAKRCESRGRDNRNRVLSRSLPGALASILWVYTHGWFLFLRLWLVVHFTYVLPFLRPARTPRNGD